MCSTLYFRSFFCRSVTPYWSLSTSLRFLKMPSAAPWRPPRCSVEASWRQSSALSTARTSSRPAVVLWTFSTCLWTIIWERYFQRQLHCWESSSPHPWQLQKLRGASQPFKRIKTFLRNTMNQDRLNALAMLSMGKRLVTDMADFNQRVIDKFAALKERRAKFLFY